jgi:hypothetical protein
MTTFLKNIGSNHILLNREFSFSAKNEYKLVAERRAKARREAVIHLKNPDWRCILNIARTNFYPRRASRGEGGAGAKSWLRHEYSKLPKNRKNIGSDHILKENFS